MAALCASSAGALADESVADTRVPAPHPVASAAVREAPIDHRVKLLARELDLDAHQQGELRQILEHQRDAVRKVWNDRSLSPSERTPATVAVVERTSGEIRAILNDEQKRKYNPPKPSPAPDTKPVDVSAWMDAARKK
jgi:hypothetical protein